MIFHICSRSVWERAKETGRYEGTELDRKDGFLHFSTAEQVRESAARHLRGVEGLVLVCVEPESLGDALKWEKSRRGLLFPHLYGALPVDAATAVHDLPLGSDGLHRFPPFI